MKFNKKEKKIFIDKEYIIILTFPIKYLKSRKLNLIIKKYDYINISVVFSKNTNNKIYHHVWFEHGKQDYKTWSDNFKYKLDFSNLLNDLKKLKK